MPDAPGTKATCRRHGGSLPGMLLRIVSAYVCSSFSFQIRACRQLTLHAPDAGGNEEIKEDARRPGGATSSLLRPAFMPNVPSISMRLPVSAPSLLLSSKIPTMIGIYTNA